jgi:calcineurin-like phosphoesterase family protein
MNTFFTSDLHFGHARVIEYSNRPFKNVDEMDEALVANWNAVVQPNDTVYLVGDVSFHRHEKTLALLSRLQGNIGLILGNHDKKLKPEALRRFAFVKDMYTAKIEDPDAGKHSNGVQRIVLCHYALRVWEASHYGAWSLYGHSHGSLPDNPRVKAFDVGVDCHDYRPISYERVKEIMATKTFAPVDHHGRRDEEDD